MLINLHVTWVWSECPERCSIVFISTYYGVMKQMFDNQIFDDGVFCPVGLCSSKKKIPGRGVMHEQVSLQDSRKAMEVIIKFTR